MHIKSNTAALGNMSFSMKIIKTWSPQTAYADEIFLYNICKRIKKHPCLKGENTSLNGGYHEAMVGDACPPWVILWFL